MVNKIIKMSLSDVLSCDDLELLELKAFELEFAIDTQRNKLLGLSNGDDYRKAINNACKSEKGQILYLLKIKGFNEKFLKKIYSRIKALKNVIKYKAELDSRNIHLINTIDKLSISNSKLDQKNKNLVTVIDDLKEALTSRNNKILTLHNKIKRLEIEIEKIKGKDYLISLVTSNGYKSLEC